MWIALALLAAFGAATQDALSKRFLALQMSPYLVGGAEFTVAGIAPLAYSIPRGTPHLDMVFVGAVCATVLLNIIGQLLVLRALGSGDMSLVSPMLAFTPVFLILTSFLMLGEVPSVTGVLGILIVVVGSYVLNGGLSHSPRQIFETIRKNPAGISMLIVTFIF